MAKILWHVLRILAIVFLAAEPPAMATEATANLLINSGPDIDQDHAGLTAYPVPVDGSVSVASIDDWDISAYLTAAGLTQQMIADAPPGLRHAMRYLIGTGAALGRPTDGFEIFQNLNPDQAAALGYGTAAPQTSCVAFYARSHAVTGNFGFAIKNGIASRGWATTFNVPAADAWTTVTIAPIPGDSYGAGTSSATISATGTAGTNILTVGTTAGRAVGESVTAVGIPAGDFINAILDVTHVSLGANLTGAISGNVTFAPTWAPSSYGPFVSFHIVPSAGTAWLGTDRTWLTTPIGFKSGGTAPLSTSAQNAQLSTVSGAYLDIAGVNWQLGTSCAPAQQVEPHIELVRAMRWEQVSYDPGVAVGTAHANNPITLPSPATSGRAYAHSFRVPFKVAMCDGTGPIVTVYSAKTGASGKIYESSGNADIDGTVSTVGTNNFVVTANFNWLAGKFIQLHYRARCVH